MRLFINFIFIFCVNLFTIAQSKYDFNLKVLEKSNILVKVDTIDQDIFSKSLKKNPLPDYFIKDSDSILKLILFKHKDVLTLNDTCLVFKTTNKEKKLCKYTSQTAFKNYKDFKLIGQKSNYLIFENIGYEWWEFFCYNPKTKKSFTTMDAPLFISKNLVFSYGNYYLEGQFEILDLDMNKYYGFITYNWELIELNRINKSFYLKFKSNDEENDNRFIKITTLN